MFCLFFSFSSHHHLWSGAHTSFISSITCYSLSFVFLVFRVLITMNFFQVRSLAAESSRAFQGGPLEPSYYKEASLAISGERSDALEGQDELSFPSSNQYTRKLDWFSVDLEEEHSALDGQILEEHTEYVVYAVHRVLIDLFLFQKSIKASYMYFCVAVLEKLENNIANQLKIELLCSLYEV